MKPNLIYGSLKYILALQPFSKLPFILLVFSMKFICTVLLLFISFCSLAQTDSAAGSLSPTGDSMLQAGSTGAPLLQQGIYRDVRPAYLLTWFENDSAHRSPFQVYGLPPLKNKPFYLLSHDREVENNDALFYLLTGIMLFLAFLRTVFSKYFDNIFRLFFQSSFRQRQTRDQLAQNRLASLFFNILFFVTAALFITLVLYHKQPIHPEFWELFLYSVLAIGCIYAGKFLFISFTGWLFQATETAATYLFIVFLANKIAGICLLPLLFFIAYGDIVVVDVVVVIAIGLLTTMFVYRYVVGYTTLHRELRLNPLHFFIYLCGVEIAPLLVIYKVVLNQIETSI